MIPHSLPPAEAISCDPIREAMEKYVAARGQAHEAKRTLIELEQGRPVAERQDAELLADSLGKVGRPPRPSHLAAHDAKTAEARVRAQATEINEQRAADEFERALAEHGDEWREQLAAQRLALLADKNRLADDLAMTLARIRSLMTTEGFAHGRPYSEAKYQLKVAMPPRGDYDRIAADWLVESLRSVGQPPAPQREQFIAVG